MYIGSGTEARSLSGALKCMNYQHVTKSGLRKVHNCMGELALHFEMVASFYMCQPNHIPDSYSHFMFSLHSDLTRANVVKMCCTVSGKSYTTKGIPYSIIHRFVATQFS